MVTAHLAKAFEKPSYRRYWLAYSLSALGFELVTFALMVILFDITGTAVSMGAFTAIYMFCLVAFGPPAGIYIDLWNRKRIFIVCNILLALLISSQQFLTGVFWISFERSPAQSPQQAAKKRSWRDLAAGIRFILSHERLRFYLSVGLLWRLFLASQLPLYIVFVKDYLGGGTREYSLFMTVLSMGGALGSLLAGGMGNRFSHHPRPFSFPWDCSRC